MDCICLVCGGGGDRTVLTHATVPVWRSQDMTALGTELELSGWLTTAFTQGTSRQTQDNWHGLSDH